MPEPKTISLAQTQHTITDDLLRNLGIGKNVRLARSEDVRRLVELENACFDPHLYDSLLTAPAARHLIGRGNGILLVWDDGSGKVDGYTQITFRKNLSEARLYSIAVHPEAQGKGIGGLLLDASETLSRALGATTFQLEIREDNTPHKHRYLKRGYTIYRKVKDYYADNCAAIKMKRKLA